jgi:hypothetical protein
LVTVFVSVGSVLVVVVGGVITWVGKVFLCVVVVVVVVVVLVLVVVVVVIGGIVTRVAEFFLSVVLVDAVGSISALLLGCDGICLFFRQ